MVDNTPTRVGAVIALALLSLGGLLLAQEPEPTAAPPKPVVRACAPAPGTSGRRAQVFRAEVHVEGIACISCAGPLLLQVANEPGVCGAQLRSSGDLLVDYQPTVVDIARVLDVVDDAGYRGAAWSEGAPRVGSKAAR